MTSPRLYLPNLFVLLPITSTQKHGFHPAAHTHIYTQVLECLTPSAPRGERFVQQQLSEEVSWDSALKVFQVIWWRCLPEVHRNGSFTFFMAGELLLSADGATPASYEPREDGRMEGGRDSCSGGLWLCRAREMVCSNQWGSKMSYGLMCLWSGLQNNFLRFCSPFIAQETRGITFEWADCKLVEGFFAFYLPCLGLSANKILENIPK